MTSSRKSAAALGLLGCSVTAPACFVQASDPAPVLSTPTGLLTVDFSVEETTDPGACAAYGASDLALDAYDAAGYLVGSFHAPCGGFTITVELETGVYSADVTLVDAADRPVTTTLTLDALRVGVGDELVVDVDFPADSTL